MTAVVRRLPFGLAEILPANLLGFAVINSFTFAVDLGLLTALHGGLRAIASAHPDQRGMTRHRCRGDRKWCPR
jgi:hypothetical protein